MKMLKNLLFTLILITGCSIVGFAQKSDDKKPPKEKPPVVSPVDKNKPKDPPPSNDKPKKPQSEMIGNLITYIQK